MFNPEIEIYLSLSGMVILYCTNRRRKGIKEGRHEGSLLFFRCQHTKLKLKWTPIWRSKCVKVTMWTPKFQLRVMAITPCSVLEKNYSLLPASPAKFKQDGWTGHTLFLLTSNNNAPESQISLSVTFLQLPTVFSIRFLVIYLSQLLLETVCPITQKRKENFLLCPEDSSSLSIRLSFHTQTKAEECRCLHIHHAICLSWYSRRMGHT